MKITIGSLLVLLLFLPPAVFASEMPPSNARPLSEIVRTLEEQGFGPIVEVEFDDGRWEVEAYRNGVKRELRIDPVSGKILSDREDH